MFKKIINSIKISIWLAIVEIKARYLRSIIGPFWSAIILFVMVIVIGPIYSLIFNQTSDYILNLAVGLFAWQFILNNLTDASFSFQKIENLYQNKNIGLFVPSLKTLISNLILSGHQLVSMFIIFFIWSNDSLIKIIILMPLIFFLSVFVYPIIFIVSLISLRYRDIQSALNSALFMIFFLSPIIWSVEMIPESKRFFVNYNPITHIINIFRELVLNLRIDFLSILIILFISAVLYIFSFLFYKKVKHKFIFWF